MSGTASADTTPQEVGSLLQYWTNTALVAADDDWSGVPGITGYRGDGLTAAPGVDPQTVVADGAAVVDVTANQMTPVDGVSELEIVNPTIALRGSDTASAPHLVLAVDSSLSAQHGVLVRFVVRDLDGSANDAVQQVALQYRVGATGNFTNVPGGFVADATTANSATKATAVSAQLPADAGMKSLIHIRIITTNASGADEAIGIDDIRVTLGSLPPFGAGVTTPYPVGRTQPVTFLATIDPGVGPASTGLVVSCNMSTLGASTQTFLLDDGLSGDVTAGDLVFTKVVTVPPSTLFGIFTVSCTVTDDQARATSFGTNVFVAAVCGDGAIQNQELCDDGNTASDDGCTAACNPEMGWLCSGEPSVCIDQDECGTSTALCVAEAVCTNTPGSYTCSCPAGYTGNGVDSCDDIDECGTSDDCDVNATCANTSGSFTCACNAGYVGDGRTCEQGSGNNGGGGGGGGCATSDASVAGFLALAALLLLRRRATAR